MSEFFVINHDSSFMTQLFKYQAKRGLLTVRALVTVSTFGALVFVSGTAQAIVTSDVLPKGVRAGAFVWGRSNNVNASFDKTGELVSMAAPLNRSVTLDDLAEVEPRLKTLEKVLNGMSAEQLGTSLFMSNFYSNIKVMEQRFVTGLLWGITDRVSLGFIVPLVHRRTQVSFDTQVVNNAQAIQARLGHIPKVKEGLQEFIDANINHDTFVQELFLSKGYQAPASHEFKALGDIELESRYRYYQSEKLSLAVRGTVKLPTASHKADISNLTDKDVGEGVVAFKLGAIQSLSLLPYRLSVHGGVFGTYRMPGDRIVALPSDPQEPLANLNDPNQIENVRKYLGPSVNTDVGVMLDFWKGAVSLMGSYQYLLRAPDRYVGSRGLDYKRLEVGTGGHEHGVEFSFELSSVPLFLDQKALAPAKLSFSWYQPLAGKNMIYAPYGRVDVVLLF